MAFCVVTGGWLATATVICALLIDGLHLSKLDEVENFLRMHEWNKELLNRIDDYEIVYPIQIRDRNRVGINTRNYLFTNTTVHFDRCSFIIKSNYGRFKLHVHLNENLMPPGASYRFLLDTDSDFKMAKNVANCYFQGEVQGFEDSLVSLSTCQGLRGFLSMDNQTFILIPLKGGDLGRRHPHVFKRVRGTDESLCGNTANTEWDSVLHRKKSLLGRSSVRYATHETKFIELMIVTDLSMYEKWKRNFAELLHGVLETVNGVDLLFHELGAKVSLTHFHAWTTKNMVLLHEDIVQSLLDFIRYSSRNLFNENVDVILLLTSADFARFETTMSASGTVCTARAAGIVKEARQFDSYRMAIMMAHGLGHILGMKHEDHDSDCACAHNGGCIMNNFLKGKNRQAAHFTDCNKEDFYSLLNSGQGRCLFNQPLKGGLLHCGNKIVDSGEQCDCGTVEECDTVDPCCDPVTCTLKEESQCSHGACCENCKFLAVGTPCRESEDQCDVSEYCTGNSGECPNDAHYQDSSPCGSDSGFCYRGRCHLLAQQCKTLWGSEASVAELACFQKFNILGVEYGHCGLDSSGRYLACSVANSVCGLLYCKEGEESLSAPSYFKTQFVEDRKLYECKALIGNSTALKFGLVEDGTKCGPNHLCIGQKCVLLDAIKSAVSCPTNNVALHCSGHGVCTNLGTCYCNEGWDGFQCDLKRNVTLSAKPVASSNDKSPIDQLNGVNASYVLPPYRSKRMNGTGHKDLYVILIILGGTAGVILLVLVLLLLCYRRKTTVLGKDKNFAAVKAADSEKESSSSTEITNRTIRFGPAKLYGIRNVPSGKQKQRMLSDIGEGDDERESLSAKSKDASVVDCVLYGGHCEHANGGGSTDASRRLERGILKNSSSASAAAAPTSFTFADYKPRELFLQTRRSTDGYESEPPYPMMPNRAFGRRHHKFSDPAAALQQGAGGGAAHLHNASVALSDYVALAPKFCPMEASSTVNYDSFCTATDSVRGLNATTAAIVSPYMYMRNRHLRAQFLSTTGEDERCNCGSKRINLSGVRNCVTDDDDEEEREEEDEDEGVRKGLWLRRSPSERPRVPLLELNPTTTVTSQPSASPTSSTSSKGGIIKPQPIKLRNIEYLLKHLDIGIKELEESISPASSHEPSLPEADNCCGIGVMGGAFGNGEKGSSTESNQMSMNDVRSAAKTDVA